MLSYKHAFHVGNHADVIKHLSLIATLNHYKKKNKPFCLFDTHAGAGLYRFDEAEVTKNKEFETGSDRVTKVKTKDATLQEYINIINTCADQGLLPGSPAIGLNCLRDEDVQVLMELHPAEILKLKQNIRDNRVSIHARDGYEGVIALSPPKQKRGVVLIDPPYERADEYASVIRAVKTLLERWNNVCVLIWYPLLGQRAGLKSGLSESMIESLRSDLNKELVNVQLQMENKEQQAGMYGSGMLVINPPWQLDTVLKVTLAEVASHLGAYKYSVNTL